MKNNKTKSGKNITVLGITIFTILLVIAILIFLDKIEFGISKI